MPSAVPPTRQNGTSLPSSAASRRAARRGTARSPTARRTRPERAAASALPPAIPPATGMRLVDAAARRRASTPDALGQQAGGSHRQVGRRRAGRRRRRSPVTADRELAGRRPAAPTSSYSDDRLVDRGERVVAVGARRTDGQLEVDLRGRPHGHGVTRQAREWIAPRSVATTDQRPVRRPSRAKSSTPSASPRQPGRCPPRAAPPRPRRGEPAQPRQRARSVLRRWAKAASTTAKTSLAVAAVAGGGSRRRQRDQPGVDVGRRPEHVAPDDAGPAHVGVPGGLHGRDAVDLRARAGREPVGDLGCTITSTRSIDGKRRSRCSSTGTATL